MRIWALTSILFFSFYHNASSQDVIPDSSGFSGYVFFLPGYVSGASNFVYSGPPMIGEIGNSYVLSLSDGPVQNQSYSFGIAGELNYKFKNSRTQFFIGNRLEDLLRLDVPFGIGIRQELKNKSIIAASILTTPLEVQLWEDPFIQGEERQNTYLFYPGLRIRWGSMFRTGLELTFTARNFNYSTEKSGIWLKGQGILTKEETRDLERNGFGYKFMALYRIDHKKHRFEPAIRWILDERRGKAIRQNGYSLQLTYIYRNPKNILDFNLLFGQRWADKRHPIYGPTLKSNRYGIGITDIFPIKKLKSSFLALLFSAEALLEDSNIDFYDARGSSIFLGIMWKHNRP